MLKKTASWGIATVALAAAGICATFAHSLINDSPTSLLACMDAEKRWYAWTCEQVLRHRSFTPEQIRELNLNAGARFPIYVADPAKAEEMLKLFLVHGVDIDAPDVSTNEWTALHAAVMSGDVSAVKLLLKYGARTDVRDRNGMTPLDLARRTREKRPTDTAISEMVQLLEAVSRQAAQ